MNYQPIVDFIVAHWDTILQGIFQFKMRIHGGEFDGGIYALHVKDKDLVVISVGPIDEEGSEGIFWGIPVLKPETFTVGINSYDAKDIIKTLRKPQPTTLDIDYTCSVHKKHRYIVCDRCDGLLRFERTMYSCRICNYDVCVSCHENTSSHKHALQKNECTCNAFYGTVH